MVPSILYLVVGFFIGTLISSLIFFKTVTTNKKKQSLSIEERNQLIRSIAEMLADIDTLITSYRSGLLKEDGFRNSINSKLDAVNKFYKPNMHILDVYYVKYIDAQICKYSEFAHGKITHFQFDGKPAFDNEYSSIGEAQSIPSISKTEAQPAADFFTDNPVNNLLSDAVNESFTAEPEQIKIADESVIESDKIEESIDKESSDNSDQLSVMVDEEQFDEFDFSSVVGIKEPTTDKIASGNDDIQKPTIEEPVIQFLDSDKEEKPVVIDEEPVKDVDLPVVEDSILVAEEKISALDEEGAPLEDTNANAIESENDADEIIFEVKPEVGIDKKRSTSETTINIAKKAGSVNFDKQNTPEGNSVVPESKTVSDTFKGTVNHLNPESEKSSFQKEYEQAAKDPEEEDLMETIMDLDMGKILRAGSMNTESVNKTSLPPKYTPFARISDVAPQKNIPAQQSAKIDEPETLGGALHETILLKMDTSGGEPVQPENSASGQEKIVVARGDEEGANTILEDAPADFEVSIKAAENKDVAITGDDVASKIDSFFGIK